MDGRVSSLVISVSVCSVVFVLLLMSHTNPSISRDERHRLTRGIFSILFCAGVIMLIVVLIDIKRRTNKDTRKSLTSSEKNENGIPVLVWTWLHCRSSTTFDVNHNDTRTRRFKSFMCFSYFAENFLRFVSLSSRSCYFVCCKDTRFILISSLDMEARLRYPWMPPYGYSRFCTVHSL